MAFRPLDTGRVKNLSGYTIPEGASKTGKNLLAPLRLLEVMQGFALEMNKR